MSSSDVLLPPAAAEADADAAPQGPVPFDYRSLLATMGLGYCIAEAIYDAADEPVDYRFLEVSPAFVALAGMDIPLGSTVRQVLPDIDPGWVRMCGQVARTGTPVAIEYESKRLRRWFEVNVAQVAPAHARRFAVVSKDIHARKLAESRLRESEERFREFADTAPAMLWATNADGHCTFLSRGWYDYTGQNEQTGLGFGWLDVVHPDDRDEARRTFVAALAPRQPFALEHRVRRADGVWRRVVDAGAPRFDSAGAFEGYVGSVIDIHELRRVEERLDLIAKTGQIGFWACDLPFSTLDWTPKVKEHFGLPADAIVTIETFYERLQPDDRERTAREIEQAIALRSDYDIEYRTVGLDGRVRWIRAIGRAHYDGERPESFNGITIDVSERALHEAALAEADRRKDRFIATLAHELRNPLAPISNGVDLLRKAPRDGEVVGRALTIMERQTRHLVQLVDDLLDVSRISAGKIRLRPASLDVADALQQALEANHGALEAAGLWLEVAPVLAPLPARADSTRLVQVFSNLLSNAAKFTPRGGTVRVSARREAAEAVVTIADTGIGIDPDALPRMFEMFAQGEEDPLHRSVAGLGIGLALSRALVEMHHGSLTAHSEGRGHGAEFVVRLPLEPQPAPSPTRTGERLA